jgi:5-methylcytosine-specific restriction endonuclease McrA
MKIESVQRPWQKKQYQGKTYTDTSFYRTQAWRALREQKLRKDPYCECDDCKGKRVIADMVDHKIPIELGGNPLDINNLQSMRNHPCHDRKRAREKNAKYSKL